jgi:hypothetical protein
MAEDLTALLARVRAAVPGLADVPDAALAQALAADAGPSVADALSGAGGAPTFRTSNEKDPSGAAVVRAAVSPWTKAATIGAPGLGDRYPLASVGEILASANPLKLLAEYVTGPGRPRSVQAADPIGVDAFTQGKGPMPMLMGTTEDVGASLADDLLARHGSTARPEATSFILKDGTRIRGGGNTTHADLANAIGQRVDDLQLDGIVRNVHQQGIEVATPITEAQARIAVDDAKVGDYPLNVDVMGPGGLKTKAFTRPSVTGVRTWIREALK